MNFHICKITSKESVNLNSLPTLLLPLLVCINPLIFIAHLAKQFSYFLYLQGSEAQPNQQHHARSFFRPIKASETVSRCECNSHFLGGQYIKDGNYGPPQLSFLHYTIKIHEEVSQQGERSRCLQHRCLCVFSLCRVCA